MKTTKMVAILVLALGMIFSLAKVSKAAPLGTAFTYQGRLLDDNVAADGLYDFEFRLYDALMWGSQAGPPVMLENVTVNDGYFTAVLDFGGGAFDGNARWLQIGVRPGGSAGDYTALTPLQSITPAPYCIHSASGSGSGLWSANGSDINNTNEGNVGVGTSSPEGKLHVATESSYGDITFFDFGSGLNDLYIVPESEYTGTTTRVYVVQITSASGSFDLFKWSDDNGITWSSDQLQVSDERYDLSYGIGIVWDEVTDHAVGDAWVWQAFPSVADALVVNNGRVGIGTSNPACELEVADLAEGGAAESAVKANDAGGAIAAYSSTLGDPFTHYAGRVSLFSNLETTGLDLRADGGSSDIRFYTGGISTANERMRIDSSGNVGIGTTSPASKLQVTGDEVRIGSGGTVTKADGDGDLYVQNDLEVGGTLYANNISSTPGCDFDTFPDYDNIPSSWTNIGSISLTLPADGYVIVTFSGSVLTSTSGAGYLVTVGIGTNPTYVMKSLNCTADRDGGYIPFSVQYARFCYAGTYTFYGNAISGDPEADIKDAQMTAIYMPKRY